MPAFGVGSKLAQLNSIASVTGAHLDVERHDEKLVIIIRSVSASIGMLSVLGLFCLVGWYYLPLHKQSAPKCIVNFRKFWYYKSGSWPQ